MYIYYISDQGEEMETKCNNYQSCAEDLRRNLQSLSSQTDSLKVSNKKLQTELSKTKANYESKVEQLSKQLKIKDRGVYACYSLQFITYSLLYM